jgi:S-formylglutathione hydrolase FrmB
MGRLRTIGLAVGILVPVCCLVVVVSALAPGATGGPAPPVAAPDRAAGITRQVLHVAVPGTKATREVVVYRPAVPDSANLPVLYFLHGSSGSATDPFDAGLPQVIARLIRAGYPPFVLASPGGIGVSHRDTEWANAVDGTDQFETFVTRSVIDAVEGRSRRDRNRRAIAGFSMGGYGAVNLALRHPDLYGQVVPIAGYFHVDDTSGVFGNQLAAIDANTPELHLASAGGARILIVDGDQGRDRVVKGESQLFYQQLVAAHVPASYEQLVGNHSWAFVAAAFPDVARFLDADWSTLRPPVPEPAVGERSEATGHWHGDLSGAHVEVSLVSASDARAARIEGVRAALGAAPVSYVVVTLSNPAGASAPVSLFKSSLVDAAGTTVDANPASSVLDEWLTEATRRPPGRRSATSTTGATVTSGPAAAGGRRAPDAAAISGARELERALRDQTVVAPGETKTAVLVTTAVVRDVASVFVGNSFAVDTLERTS